MTNKSFLDWFADNWWIIIVFGYFSITGLLRLVNGLRKGRDSENLADDDDDDNDSDDNRYITRLAVGASGNGQFSVYIVMSDGTFWQFDPHTRTYDLMPPIPDTVEED